MPTMTKAQARRRLKEAESKFKKVYMFELDAVKTADMEAISKIVKRCISRIK